MRKVDENSIGESVKDKISSLVDKNVGLSMGLAGSIAINIILAIAFLTIETVVKVELPPKFITDNVEQIEFEITNNKATKEHYAMLGYYYISETSSFTSKEIGKKMKLIIGAYHPDLIKKEIKEIDAETGREYSTSAFQKIKNFESNIKKEKVKQEFTIKKVHEPIMAYGNTEATLTIEGVVDQEFELIKNEDPIVKQKPCSYTISLGREGGNTYVIGYQTTCFDN